MGWPRKLVLVRHAESEGNVLSTEERVRFDRSSHEYKLTARGRKQAEITGKYLREKFCKFDAFYSSYYARARETLQIMYPEVTVFEDSRLAEAQRGIWHTMTKEEVARVFQHEIERKEREDLYHYRPLGGENWPDIEMRIHSFLATLNCYHEGENILVIVHGNWLNLFRKVNDHLSIEEVMRRYSLDNRGVVDNASVTVYEGRALNGKPALVLKEENTVPWKDNICNFCQGDGKVSQMDEYDQFADGYDPCSFCDGTGIK